MTQCYEEVKEEIRSEHQNKLIRNGIAAFPVQKYDGSWIDGMNLRDYFAAKALNGYVTGFTPNPLAQEAICERGYCKFENNAEAIAHSSYVLADAMMKAREQ